MIGRKKIIVFSHKHGSSSGEHTNLRLTSSHSRAVLHTYTSAAELKVLLDRESCCGFHPGNRASAENNVGLFNVELFLASLIACERLGNRQLFYPGCSLLNWFSLFQANFNIYDASRLMKRCFAFIPLHFLSDVCYFQSTMFVDCMCVYITIFWKPITWNIQF